MNLQVVAAVQYICVVPLHLPSRRGRYVVNVHRYSMEMWMQEQSSAASLSTALWFL